MTTVDALEPITYSIVRKGRQTTVTKPRPAWCADLVRLHGEGLSDAQIADSLARSRDTVKNTRLRLGLPVNAAHRRPWTVADVGELVRVLSLLTDLTRR